MISVISVMFDIIAVETRLSMLELYISLSHLSTNDCQFVSAERKGAAGNQIKFWFPAEKTDVKCLVFL